MIGTNGHYIANHARHTARSRRFQQNVSSNRCLYVSNNGDIMYEVICMYIFSPVCRFITTHQSHFNHTAWLFAIQSIILQHLLLNWRCKCRLADSDQLVHPSTMPNRVHLRGSMARPINERQIVLYLASARCDWSKWLFFLHKRAPHLPRSSIPNCTQKVDFASSLQGKRPAPGIAALGR